MSDVPGLCSALLLNVLLTLPVHAQSLEREEVRPPPKILRVYLPA
jgi:hypothetical protein